ncbi:bromodomain-containing 9-like [Olea europaea subsp. europaea]|uniref:Bromodomain-containing 9-like n=1 Tax=Olea europaea subsp. europaea TaxID=158383 RepID=A0A8S0TSV8_OLEEU|nr:bromodomain-containing 9-like [Olea europaea subsp. europaea]
MKGGKSKANSRKVDSKLVVRKTKKEKKVKDPNKPKRPPSAFFVFMYASFAFLSILSFLSIFLIYHYFYAVGKAGGDKWKSMSDEEKTPFIQKAEKRKEEYAQKIANYNKKLASGVDDDDESDKLKSEVNDDEGSGEEKKVLKTTDTVHGSPLGFGPTIPLPDKKLLVFILDRLQKKDSHGVFSEPVDPDELPDYHEIIEHPMDFGTVRKKLDGGVYKNLEELEADVFLICSNAMQYNAPDTIYFRQARTMRELAKRDFENLKHEGDDGEPQPKIVRRGRPPSKNQKKSVETSPVDHVGPEISSGATLASGEDKGTGSNSYNLRKGPMFYRFRSTDPFMSSNRPRHGENYSEWLVDWNDEFPASILKADMKYGKKHFTVDENRRDTYRQFHPQFSGNEPSVFSNSVGDMKQLMPVGLHFEPLAYACSLARFAANLGPVAWKVASKKIHSVLPAGVKFGPGWVGQYEAPSRPLTFSTKKQNLSNNPTGDCHSSRLVMSSNSDLNSSVAYIPSEKMVEAVKKLDSQNEASAPGEACLRTQFQALSNSIDQGHRNGFSGMFGYNLSAMGTSRGAMPGHSGGDEGPSQTLEMVPRNNPSMTQPSASDNVILEEAKLPKNWNTLQPGSNAEPSDRNSGKSSWQALSMQQRHTLPIPPDLNVRVQGGSPSSSLQIGSPHQPDLALQL